MLLLALPLVCSLRNVAVPLTLFIAQLARAPARPIVAKVIAVPKAGVQTITPETVDHPCHFPAHAHATSSVIESALFETPLAEWSESVVLDAAAPLKPEAACFSD